MVQALTIRQLSCIVAVDEMRHFRRAADRLDMTQPALSAQIRNLELALNTTLFERSRSGVTPTPAGREVIARAREILDQAQGIVDFCRTAKEGLSGTLRLGVSPTVGPYVLPAVVAQLHRQYSDLKLFIRERPPQDLDAELLEGRHDLILTQLPSMSEELIDVPIVVEPLMVAMSEDHPLASGSAVNPKDLAGQAVLSLNPRYRLAEQVASFCERFGAHVRTDYEGTSLDAIRQMVAMNVGIAFLPKLYVRTEIRDDDGVEVRPLKTVAFNRTLGLVYRRRSGQSVAIKTLASLVADVAKKRLGD